MISYPGEIGLYLKFKFGGFLATEGAVQPFCWIGVVFAVVIAVYSLAKWDDVGRNGAWVVGPGIAKWDPVIGRKFVPKTWRTATDGAAAVEIVEGKSPMVCRECGGELLFLRATSVRRCYCVVTQAGGLGGLLMLAECAVMLRVVGVMLALPVAFVGASCRDVFVTVPSLFGVLLRGMSGVVVAIISAVFVWVFAAFLRALFLDGVFGEGVIVAVLGVYRGAVFCVAAVDVLVAVVFVGVSPLRAVVSVARLASGCVAVGFRAGLYEFGQGFLGTAFSAALGWVIHSVSFSLYPILRVVRTAGLAIFSGISLDHASYYNAIIGVQT